MFIITLHTHLPMHFHFLTEGATHPHQLQLLHQCALQGVCVSTGQKL